MSMSSSGWVRGNLPGTAGHQVSIETFRFAEREVLRVYTETACPAAVRSPRIPGSVLDREFSTAKDRQAIIPIGPIFGPEACP
jgi:hypothetical protein